MAGEIYRKPIIFSITAGVVILIGTVATMFYPMFTPSMHPKLDDLNPYTALELAGKDVYQQEGCNNCHTQTVRPLKSEVMRYGEYSKAGEFAYDRPFLWGSKRTGPDLARIGGKYPDMWHIKHFENPRDFYEKSNMPAYGWLAKRKLDPAAMRKRMDVNGFPYTEENMEALERRTELDALVAYMQVIGTAVARPAPAARAAIPADKSNPLAGDLEALEQGEMLYGEHCAMCHGDDAEGDIGPGLTDYDAGDPDFYEIIAAGVEGEMPGFAAQLDRTAIWSIVSYLRSLGASASGAAPAAGMENPLAGSAEAIEEGAEIFKRRCAMCHGADLAGKIGPSLVDTAFLGGESDGADGNYFTTIKDGTGGGMPPFGNQLGDELIWSIVSYIRAQQGGK
jgi:cytochrome c oxidase cbb3-type subunit 2